MNRVGSLLISTCVKALAQSMPTNVMLDLVRKLIPNYDLHGRLGFPRSMAIPNKDAARQIIKDTVKNDCFIDFVLLMVDAGNNGVMGRRYSIPYMNQIILGVFDLGYIYDGVNNIFVENPKNRLSRNWGTLKTGKDYGFAFMRLDIAGNSKMVRENSEKDVHKAYKYLREVTTRAVLKRNGRLWSWDGDGGLASFFFGNKQQSAVIAGKEILHELFFYNYLNCPLKTHLKVRIAVHSGTFEYSPYEEDLKACDAVKKVMEIESYFTKPGTMTISQPVKFMLDNIARTGIKLLQGKGATEYHNYELILESK